jgi:gluconolactonase
MTAVDGCTVFARVPPELMRDDRPCRWSTAVLGQERIGSFLEGPCFSPDGTLYVSDLAHGRILRAGHGGRLELHLDYGGAPNGMAALPDGSLLIADYARGLLRLGADRTLITLVDGFRHEPFLGLSDIVIGQDGAVYLSDQGQSDLRRPVGRVFRWRPDSGLELLLDGVPSPNGLALNPAEDTLYVAVTRANAVYRVPLRSDGSVGKVGVHVYLSGGSGGPDGLATDQLGGLAVAHYGLGRVWLFDRRGLPAGHIDTPEGDGLTNVAYGGPDGRLLYITDASTGSILVCDAPEAGYPLYSHRAPDRQAADPEGPAKFG